MVLVFLKRCQRSRRMDLAKPMMLARIPNNVVGGPFQGYRTAPLRDVFTPMF